MGSKVGEVSPSASNYNEGRSEREASSSSSSSESPTGVDAVADFQKRAMHASITHIGPSTPQQLGGKKKLSASFRSEHMAVSPTYFAEKERAVPKTRNSMEVLGDGSQDGHCQRRLLATGLMGDTSSNATMVYLIRQKVEKELKDKGLSNGANNKAAVLEAVKNLKVSVADMMGKDEEELPKQQVSLEKESSDRRAASSPSVAAAAAAVGGSKYTKLSTVLPTMEGGTYPQDEDEESCSVALSPIKKSLMKKLATTSASNSGSNAPPGSPAGLSKYMKMSQSLSLISRHPGDEEDEQSVSTFTNAPSTRKRLSAEGHSKYHQSLSTFHTTSNNSILSVGKPNSKRQAGEGDDNDNDDDDEASLDLEEISAGDSSENESEQDESDSENSDDESEQTAKKETDVAKDHHRKSVRDNMSRKEIAAKDKTASGEVQPEREAPKTPKGILKRTSTTRQEPKPEATEEEPKKPKGILKRTSTITPATPKESDLLSHSTHHNQQKSPRSSLLHSLYDGGKSLSTRDMQEMEETRTPKSDRKGTVEASTPQSSGSRRSQLNRIPSSRRAGMNRSQSARRLKRGEEPPLSSRRASEKRSNDELSSSRRHSEKKSSDNKEPRTPRKSLRDKDETASSSSKRSPKPDHHDQESSPSGERCRRSRDKDEDKKKGRRSSSKARDPRVKRGDGETESSPKNERGRSSKDKDSLESRKDYGEEKKSSKTRSRSQTRDPNVKRGASRNRRKSTARPRDMAASSSNLRTTSDHSELVRGPRRSRNRKSRSDRFGMSESALVKTWDEAPIVAKEEERSAVQFDPSKQGNLSSLHSLGYLLDKKENVERSPQDITMETGEATQEEKEKTNKIKKRASSMMRKVGVAWIGKKSEKATSANEDHATQQGT